MMLAARMALYGRKISSAVDLLNSPAASSIFWECRQRRRLMRWVRG